MTKLATIASITALLLVGCGGVDRDGSRDNFIDLLEDQGLTADPDCVDEVLDGYSDDELKDLDKIENQDTDEFAQFSESLAQCVGLDE